MYTRYPVYRRDLDHVTGFVHTKDILIGRMSTDASISPESSGRHFSSRKERR